MRKNILISVMALTITMSMSALAVTHATSKKEKTAVSKTSEKTPITETIDLYELPNNTAKIIKKLPVETNLVGIFQQGDWMKVGDRQDGATGWINLSQYHQAKQAYYKKYFTVNSETIYVHTQKDKDGKQVIEAYRNGKKLSDADAKKMLNQMQTQEHKQWESLQHFDQMMNLEMQRDYWDAKQQFDAAFHAPILFTPGIVVIEKPAGTEDKKDKK